MRKYLLYLLFLVVVSSSFGQSYDKKQFRNIFQDAEYFFLFEDYKSALPLFLELYNLDSVNSNINYKIGVCYSEDKLRSHHAIKYFEKAVVNISPKYKESSYKETGAPFDTYYYLGKALQRDFEFDRAIIAFEKYETYLQVADIFQIEKNKKNIEACHNAKELLVQSALNFVKVDILSSNVNSPYPDYSPVLSGDGKTLIFTSRRRYRLNKEGEVKLQDMDVPDEFYMEDIYMSKMVDNVWGKVVKISNPMKADVYTSVVSISYDGKKLFLLRKDILTGNKDEGNIYMSEWNGSRWTSMKRLNKNINTTSWETHAALSKDETKLYFTSVREGGFGGLDIYVSTADDNGEWGPAVNLGSEINSSLDEEYPFILEDGKTLYFSSQGHYNIGGHDIFYSKMTEDGQWSTPINLGYPLNTMDDDIFYSPIDDGKSAYISLETYDGLGSSDIYRIDISESSYGDFGSQEFLSDNNDSVAFPCNLADLYKINDRIDSSSIRETIKYDDIQTDIVIPVWAPLHAKKVLVKGRIILVDNNTIDTTFVLNIKDDNVLQTEVKVIPTLISGNYRFKTTLNEFVIKATGEGYHDAIKKVIIPLTFIGEEMVVNIEMYPISDTTTVIKPTKIIATAQKKNLIIKGNIILSDNNLVDNSFVITVKDPNNSQENREIIPQAETGEYLFETDLNELTLYIEGAGYKSETRVVVIPVDYSASEMVVDINMDAIQVASGEYYTIKSIFFDYGKSELRRESQIELEKLYSLMEKNPSLYVEVTGHTDSKSSSSFNLKLSKARATAAIEYLSLKGISPERFVAKGMGEDNPIAINANPDGTDNPDGRQFNRRVDIKILQTDANNIVVEDVYVPDFLRSSRFGQAKKELYYVLIIKQKTKYTKESVLTYNEHKLPNGYAYTVGKFEDKALALKLLTTTIDLGYNEAKIIDSKELNILITGKKPSSNQTVVKPKTDNNANNTVVPKDGRPVYAIQLKALSKPINMSVFKDMKGVKEYLGADGYYRYTYLEFSSREEATIMLSKIKAQGYNDAFVINVNRYKLRETQGQAEYTIQIKAMKTPLNMKYFNNITGVKEYISNDGYYKYTYGKYKKLDDAKKDLKKIKKKGYSDAFIVNVEKYN